MALRDVWGATVLCPVEGCPFAFRVENVLSEEEGKALLVTILRAHGRFSHGSVTFFDPQVYSLDRTFRSSPLAAAKRDELPN